MHLCVSVGACWGGGRNLGWIVVSFKIPWSIYLMLILNNQPQCNLVTSLWCFFASPWQGEPTDVSVWFFFPYFSAGFSENGVHSLASSFFLGFSQHWLSFNRNISWLQLLWQVSITLLCHLYKALLYVHDFELVEIGVWWTMSVFFFSHPTRPKCREIKMEKQKTKKKERKTLTCIPGEECQLKISFLEEMCVCSQFPNLGTSEPIFGSSRTFGN